MDRLTEHRPSPQTQIDHWATYSGGFVPCQQRARWIVNHVSQTRDRKTHVLPRRYVSGECHFYLDRRHQLKVIVSKTKPPSVRRLRGQLCVAMPDRDPARIHSLLSQWYWVRAEVVIERELREEASQVAWVCRKLLELKLLAMKKQWGRYSPKGRII
jgi:hypothetical protein